MRHVLDGVVKAYVLIVLFSLTFWPEETGKLWRVKYDRFMIGWNSK